jgi:quinol-cytochrome oxidoreductase complex cytochrome b subunit
MKIAEKFVHGGGWVDQQKSGRPRCRFFCALSIVWAVVAAFALSVLMTADADTSNPWVILVCLAFALPLPVFIMLALHFRRKESLQTWTERVQNPNVDARKFY